MGTGDRRLDRGQRTEDRTKDLQDSEVFETTEVRLADDCQVVSIQITGTGDRRQETGDRSHRLVGAEDIIPVITSPVPKLRETFWSKHPSDWSKRAIEQTSSGWSGDL